MSASGQLWMTEYVTSCEQFLADLKSMPQADAEANFAKKLRALGFDQIEIDDEISGLMA